MVRTSNIQVICFTYYVFDLQLKWSEWGTSCLALPPSAFNQRTWTRPLLRLSPTSAL